VLTLTPCPPLQAGAYGQADAYGLGAQQQQQAQAQAQGDAAAAYGQQAQQAYGTYAAQVREGQRERGGE
jgi:hypothetical protein